MKLNLRNIFYLIFNPRTREGCDKISILSASRMSWHLQSTHPWRVRRRRRKGNCSSCRFQSTHPWRVRRNVSFDVQFHYNDFNPRTREGCDTVAIHTAWWNTDFNPRTREGCDLAIIEVTLFAFCYFNPRTREGCDVPICCPIYPGEVFQSTHPRRVRLGPMSSLSTS